MLAGFHSANIEAARSVCSDVYKKTAAFYAPLASHFGDHAFGYKILYSPPIVDAPFLFLGFQPGGTLPDAEAGEKAGERIGWPAENEYAKATWKLAVKARRIWGDKLLRESVGLNNVFFRSPKREVWDRLPTYWRQMAEDFSRIHCRAVVDTLRPRRIVIFGLKSVADFDPNGETLRTEKRRLVLGGRLWGYPAHAVIHPSGARLSADDEALISRYFLNSQPDRWSAS
jgi:hypothetical protein